MNLIYKLITKPFRWQNIIYKNQIVADMPSNKELLKRTFNIAWLAIFIDQIIRYIASTIRFTKGKWLS